MDSMESFLEKVKSKAALTELLRQTDENATIFVCTLPADGTSSKIRWHSPEGSYLARLGAYTYFEGYFADLRKDLLGHLEDSHNA